MDGENFKIALSSIFAHHVEKMTSYAGNEEGGVRSGSRVQVLLTDTGKIRGREG